MPFPTRFGPGHTKDGGPDRAPPPLYPSTPAVPPEQLPLKPGSDSPPLPPSNAPPAQRLPEHGRTRRAGSAHPAIASPWHVYRLYARGETILVRTEQGEVPELGLIEGAEPDLHYLRDMRDDR